MIVVLDHHRRTLQAALTLDILASRNGKKRMDWLRKIEMGPLVIIVGIISVIGWITLDGTVPLVISILAGGLIALKGTVGDAEE